MFASLAVVSTATISQVVTAFVGGASLGISAVKTIQRQLKNED